MTTRTQIRTAVHALLLPIQTAGSATVDKQGVKWSSSMTVPLINVMTDGERVESRIDESTEKRLLTVFVKITATDDEGIADTLDAISDQVEARLSVKPDLGGLVESFDYKSMNPDYMGEASSELAQLVLEYECTYLYTTVLTGDDFLTLDAKIDMSSPRNDPQTPTGPDGQIDASATISLPQ